jgi:hypothetical protein
MTPQTEHLIVFLARELKEIHGERQIGSRESWSDCVERVALWMMQTAVYPSASARNHC